MVWDADGKPTVTGALKMMTLKESDRIWEEA